MIQQMSEKWKNIDGFDNYQISSFGRVKSFVGNGRGDIKRNKGKILKNSIWKGHVKVELHHIEGKKRKIFYVHRLIAIAFIPNPGEKPQINHKDGNGLNNSIENLEWCTNGENQKHAYRLGLQLKPNFDEDNYPDAKLNKFQVARIRLLREIQPRLHYQKLAKLFGVCAGTIYNICMRRTWYKLKT